MSDTPSATPLRSRAVAALGGAFIFVALDALVGARLGLGRIEGGRRTVLFAGLIVAHAAALGLCAGLLIGVLYGALGRVRIRLGLARPSLATVMVAIGTAAVFQCWNWDLFQGGGVRAKAWRPAVEIAFRVAAVPLAAYGVFLLAALAEARGATRRSFGVACVFAAGALLLVNASVYRTQYDAIHAQACLAALALSGLGFFALLSGARLDPARTRLGAAVSCAIALAAFSAPTLYRTDRAFDAVKGVAFERAYGINKLSRISGPLVGLLDEEDRGSPPMDEIVDALFAALNASDDAAIERALREACPDGGKLNVLLIAVDTLRADRCGFLGYRREGRSPTPNLDALAAESTVFEHAYTAYPTSDFAFSGLLTSLSPRISYVYGKRFETRFRYEPEHALPTLLAAHGRRTAAVTAFNREDLADPKKFANLRPGFEIFNPDPWETAATGAQITASTTNLLNKMSAERRLPFFLWAHYLDPHDPYRLHADFPFGDSAADRYVGEIAYADREVGKLFDELKRLGLWDETIVVMCSDHGEEFGERGGRNHNSSLYEEQIRVPLLVRIPRTPHKRVRTTVSLLDVVPTLVRALGVPDPVRRQGRSLLPLIYGDENPEGGYAYSEKFEFVGDNRFQERRAFILGRKKIIRRVNEKSFEIYDLDRDPGETTTLVGRLRDENVLRAMLERWDAETDGYFGAGGKAPLTAERCDELFAEIARENDAAKTLAGADPAAANVRAAAARRAVEALRDLLLTGYGDAKPDVLLSMGEERIAETFDRLAALYPSLVDAPAQTTLSILARRRDRRYAPLFEKEVANVIKGSAEGLRSGAMDALVALSTFGDMSVAEALRVAYGSDQYPDKSMLATSLARLGDPTGFEWYALVLGSLRYGSVYRDALAALPAISAAIPASDEIPSASRFLRDRLTEEAWRQQPLNLALVAAMDAVNDEDARVILCRLARNEDEEVRRRALAALKTAIPDGADLERKLAAADDELDGDNSYLNGAAELAAVAYRRALAGAGFFNAALRFRLARALQSFGSVDRAREVLEEVELRAPLSFDRRLATRKIGRLGFKIAPDAAAFGCEVASVEIPKVVRPQQLFSVVARLKNVGSQPWFGGFGVGHPEIAARFVDDEGRVHETSFEREFRNRLPEAGVNPGEETTVRLVALGPPGGFRGRLSLYFTNDRCAYPNGGVVWTGDRRFEFGQTAESGPAPR